MRKIKNTTESGRGHYFGAARKDSAGNPLERAFINFPPGEVVEIDEATLAEILKDKIVAGWFETGELVEQTPRPKPVVPTVVEPTEAEKKAKADAEAKAKAEAEAKAKGGGK